MPSVQGRHDKGPSMIIITSVMTAVALLLVVARIMSRRLSIRKLAIDDYLVTLSILLSLIYVGLCGVATHHGAGQHVTELEPAEASKAIYFTLVAFVPGLLSIMVPKFAVMILLAKILNTGKVHRRIMWVVSVVYFLIMLGMVIINFAQCSPAATQWGGSKGKCWPRVITMAYAFLSGSTSALFDFYLAIYPTIVLCKLQMGWKKKLGLASALGFGYCAGAVTIYKCTTLTGLMSIEDFTYAVDDLILWTSIEANCVVIGACIPTLYPLIQRVFGNSVLGSTKSDSSEQQRPPLQTIGSYVHNKRRPGHLSVLDTMDNDEGGDRDAEIAERQRSENSGETTLRGDVEMGERWASEVEGADVFRDIEMAETQKWDVEGGSILRGNGRESPI